MFQVDAQAVRPEPERKEGEVEGVSMRKQRLSWDEERMKKIPRELEQCDRRGAWEVVV